jgi:hypothetical protein
MESGIEDLTISMLVA